MRKIRKKLENNHHKFTGSWRNVDKNISTENIIELEEAVTKYFIDEFECDCDSGSQEPDFGQGN